MSGWFKPCLVAWSLTSEPVSRAAVVVDASALAEADPSLESTIEEQLGARLWELDVRPRRDADDPIIWVSLQPDTNGYRFSFETGTRAQRIERRRGECTDCSRELLLARLQAHMDSVVEWIRLEEARSAPTTMPEPNAEVRKNRADRADMVPITTPAKRAPADLLLTPETPQGGAQGRSFRVAGAVLVATGAAALLSGIPLTVAGEIELTQNYRTNPVGMRYTEVGYAVLGAGAAILVTGSVLLALGVRGRPSRVSRAASRFPLLVRF